LGNNNTVDQFTIGKLANPSMARSITPSKEMPTLAQLLTSWENPTGITFWNYRYNSQGKEFYYIVGFHYHHNGDNTLFSIAYSPESSIRPEDRPYYIFISTYNPYDRSGGPWHGFGSINDYLNHGDADVQFKYLCCA
jgi:hypothetical protein